MKDVGELKARPHQKAVVYDGQLVIVNWSFAYKLIEIQERNLSNS